ncbi:MAG: hypothetical protein R3C53_16140 [Pirellulaceae bacterium]
MPSLPPSPALSDRLTRRKIPQPFASRNIGKMPAWLASILFHVTVLATIAAVWKTRSGGTGAESGGPVGVAVVYETNSGSEYYLSDAASGAEASAQSAISSLPSEASVGSSQATLLADLLPSGTGAGSETIAAAGSLGLGDGGAELGGNSKLPKAKTTVFGIEGEGTRFLYVFDRSDSMNGYNALQTAKAELLSSLESLGPAHQFQIIFYNESPMPYGGLSERGPQLQRGDEASKANAQRFVRSIAAVGGTQHVDALRMALNMAPDVIFFLTDADFPRLSETEIENIHTRASRINATIHTIQFGSGPERNSGDWIRRLAVGTAGQYRYVDVTELQRKARTCPSTLNLDCGDLSPLSCR